MDVNFPEFGKALLSLVVIARSRIDAKKMRNLFFPTALHFFPVTSQLILMLRFTLGS